jgi:hypothetical protein
MSADTSHRTQVIVAMLGPVGVIATGVLSNWDKLFGRRDDATTDGPSIESVAPTKPADGPRLPEASGEKPGLLLRETFDDNAHGWAVSRDGSNYDAYIEDGGYLLETKKTTTPGLTYTRGRSMLHAAATGRP